MQQGQKVAPKVRDRLLRGAHGQAGTRGPARRVKLLVWGTESTKVRARDLPQLAETGRLWRADRPREARGPRQQDS